MVAGGSGYGKCSLKLKKQTLWHVQRLCDISERTWLNALLYEIIVQLSLNNCIVKEWFQWAVWWHENNSRKESFWNGKCLWSFVDIFGFMIIIITHIFLSRSSHLSSHHGTNHDCQQHAGYFYICDCPVPSVELWHLWLLRRHEHLYVFPAVSVLHVQYSPNMYCKD